MVGRRGDQQDRRPAGREQRDDVVDALEARGLTEPSLKGERKQEAEQHLDAVLRDSHFLEQFDEVAIGSLERRLTTRGLGRAVGADCAVRELRVRPLAVDPIGQHGHG